MLREVVHYPRENPWHRNAELAATDAYKVAQSDRYTKTPRALPGVCYAALLEATRERCPLLVSVEPLPRLLQRAAGRHLQKRLE